MLKIISDMLAKLGVGAQPKQAAADPLAVKMHSLKWSPTEDDRSALRYEIEAEQAREAPLAEGMAAPYLGRREPFDRREF